MNFNQVKKLMERKKTTKKGENGHVLVIGGSEEYVGSLALASLAALRAGCDQVTVAAAEKVAWTINRYAPDLLTQKLKGNVFTVKNAKEMVKLADRFESVLIGSGVTRKADKFCHYFIRKSPKYKVIDGEVLRSLSFKDFYNAILTPNETELEVMLVNSGKDFLLPKLREANAKEKAEILQGNLRYFLQNDNILLLKGPTDIIISRNKVAYNRSGNPGMSKIGTGDVLAGLIAGFIAKSQDPYKSTVAASYINGLLADLLLKKKKGFSFIASDIIEDLEKLQKISGKDKRK